MTLSQSSLRLPNGVALLVSIVLVVAGAGGDYALAALCVAAILGLWREQMNSLVRMEIAACFFTFGSAIILVLWSNYPPLKQLFDHLGFSAGRHPKRLSNTAGALAAIAIGSLVISPLLSSGSWYATAGVLALMLHRVIAAFRSPEVFGISLISAVALWGYVAIIFKLGLDSSSYTWLIVGALYFATLGRIGARTHAPSISRPRAKRTSAAAV